MAITSTRKAKEAVWFPCPIPGFTDERHLLRPTTREVLTNVRDKSNVKEWERGQIVTKQDTNLFDQHYLDYLWAGWSDNVGIEHEDGHLEVPAEVTLHNKVILVNSRPIEFLLWLQRTADELAAQTHKDVEAARENFRPPDSAPPGLPAA